MNIKRAGSAKRPTDFVSKAAVCTLLDLPDDLVVDHEKDPGLQAQGRQLLVRVQQRALRDVRGRAYHTGHAQNKNFPKLAKKGR
jgi:hypothetical protein